MNQNFKYLYRIRDNTDGTFAVIRRKSYSAEDKRKLKNWGFIYDNKKDAFDALDKLQKERGKEKIEGEKKLDIMREVPIELFFEIIRFMDYRAIIKLCSTSGKYEKFCDDFKVWIYLLNRDFYPLFDEDINDLENKRIRPKNLYYKIRKFIKYVETLYKKYGNNTLAKMITINSSKNLSRLIYYGTLYLINEKHIDPSFNNNQVFRLSSSYGYIEVLRLLLQWVGPDGQRVDPTVDNNDAIREASRKGYIEIVRLLLQWVGPEGQRVDPTTKNNFAIQWASSNGHIEAVKLLLQWVGPEGQRVDPTDDNNDAIKWASYYGHTEIVKLLLEWVGPNGQKVDPNAIYPARRRDTKSKRTKI